MSFFTLRRVRKGKQPTEHPISKSQSFFYQDQQQQQAQNSSSKLINTLQISNPTPLSDSDSFEFSQLHRQRGKSISIEVEDPNITPASGKGKTKGKVKTKTPSFLALSPSSHHLSTSTPNLHKLFKSSSGQKQKKKAREGEADGLFLDLPPTGSGSSGSSLNVTSPSISQCQSQNSISSFENDAENQLPGARDPGSVGGENALTLTSFSVPKSRPPTVIRSTSLFDRHQSQAGNGDEDRSRHPIAFGFRSRSGSPSESSVSPPRSSSQSTSKKSFEFKPGKLTSFVSLVANGGTSSPSPASPHYPQKLHSLPHQVSRNNSITSTTSTTSNDYYTKNKLKTRRHLSQRSSPGLFKRSGSGRGLDEVQDVIKENETLEQRTHPNFGKMQFSMDMGDSAELEDGRDELRGSVSMMTISSSIASSTNSISSLASASASSSSISTNNTNHASIHSTRPLSNLVRRNSSGSVNINLRRKEQDVQSDNNYSHTKGPPVGQFMSLNRPKKSMEEIKQADIIIQGIKRFNRDASAGIQFLIKNQIVDSSAQDVAKFLKKGENLSKTAIGTYLGEFGEFNQSVLDEFVKLHDFTDQHLVTSLRQFLWSFRLPGEAQKIDRMMECFAQHYCALNPDVFSCTDTCYIVSFATIMLNTTLHNPNVKDKPSVEQFISMNRDIDNGKSLDPAFLTTLYNLIRNEEFQIPREEGNDLTLTFYNPDIKGWLWKQGARYKNWTRRWFILSNNCLYYFKNATQDKSPRGIIPLENIDAHQGTFNGKYFTFVLCKSQAQTDSSQSSYLSSSLSSISTGKSKTSQTTASKESIKSCKTLSDGRLVLGTHSEYVLGADSEEDRSAWIQSIQQNRSFDDYYTLLQDKKRKMTALTSKPTIKLREKKQGKKSDGPNPIRKSQIGMPLNRPKTHVNVDGMEIEMESPTEDLPPEYASVLGTEYDHEDDDDNSSLILRMTRDQNRNDDDEGDVEAEDDGAEDGLDLELDDDQDRASLLSSSEDLENNFSATSIAIDKMDKSDKVDVTMGTALLEEIPPTPLPTPHSFFPPASPCSVQIHVSDTDNNICEISAAGQDLGQGKSQSTCVIHVKSSGSDSSDLDDGTSGCESQTGGESVSDHDTEDDDETETELLSNKLPFKQIQKQVNSELWETRSCETPPLPPPPTIEVLKMFQEPQPPDTLPPKTPPPPSPPPTETESETESQPGVRDKKYLVVTRRDLASLESVSVDDTPQPQSNVFIFPDTLSKHAHAVNSADSEIVDSVFQDNLQSDTEMPCQKQKMKIVTTTILDEQNATIVTASPNGGSKSELKNETENEIVQLQVSTGNLILESSC